MLRFLTAGESHGQALTVIIEGLPAGMELTKNDINYHLARRQEGYGRGGRMKIEKDQVEILSGVRQGLTLGSPVTLQIWNKDWENWQHVMSAEPTQSEDLQVNIMEDARLKQLSVNVTKPRPGHADLSGALKYNHGDIRNILERASARETTTRVAVGAVAQKLLAAFGIEIFSHVTSIGKVSAAATEKIDIAKLNAMRNKAANSSLHCVDETVEEAMKNEIDQAKQNGDSLGGVFEVICSNVPVGLGSHVHWDRRLDGRLAQAVMSIPAVKGVEIGIGFTAADTPGSEVHDEIFFAAENGIQRQTNRAGGLEGGITNGEILIIRGAMKPIPTLYKPLRTFDLETFAEVSASVERSDVCAVPAAGVVGEAMVAMVLAQALCEKFGGDSMAEIKKNFDNYLSMVAGRLKP